MEITFGITVDHLRLFKLHQNLPQYFRRNHVADGILEFLNYFAETMSPMYLGVFHQHHVADLFLMTILVMETIQEDFYYS